MKIGGVIVVLGFEWTWSSSSMVAIEDGRFPNMRERERSIVIYRVKDVENVYYEISRERKMLGPKKMILGHGSAWAQIFIILLP